MEELRHKVGLRVAGKKNTWNCITLQLTLALYFKMLPVASSGLVLICNIFEETYFCHLHAYLLACFYEIHLKFLTSHIYFHLDDSKLWKQYQSISHEMMGQICNLETVESQEIPVKVCVMFYNIEICYRGSGEKKASFLAIV